MIRRLVAALSPPPSEPEDWLTMEDLNLPKGPGAMEKPKPRDCRICARQTGYFVGDLCCHCIRSKHDEYRQLLEDVRTFSIHSPDGRGWRDIELRIEMALDD